MKLIIGLIGMLYVVNVATGFLNEGVNLHNKYRKAHRAPPMQLDKSLNQQAQKCAERVARENKGGSMNLNHTPQNQRLGQGENLAAGTTKGSKAADVQDAIRRWYNEVNLYDFKRPNGMTGKDGKSGSVGHFTQVVWKDSKKLGLGIAYAGRNAFVCARYSPQGNFNNNNKNNVFPG